MKNCQDKINEYLAKEELKRSPQYKEDGKKGEKTSNHFEEASEEEETLLKKL